MLKVLSTSLAFVLVSTTVAQDRPAKPRAQNAKPPVVAPRIQLPALEVPVIQQLPQVNWGIRPQARRRLGGIGGARFVNPQFSAEAHFPAYITAQIARLKQMFKLDTKTERRLTVAAKGVVHRRKQSQPKQQAQVEQLGLNLVWVRNGAQPDKSAEFRKRLSNSKIWTSTLRRVLTKDQLDQWNKRRPTPVTMNPNGLLGDDVKIRVIREFRPQIVQPLGR